MLCNLMSKTVIFSSSENHTDTMDVMSNGSYGVSFVVRDSDNGNPAHICLSLYDLQSLIDELQVILKRQEKEQ